VASDCGGEMREDERISKIAGEMIVDEKRGAKARATRYAGDRLVGY